MSNGIPDTVETMIARIDERMKVTKTDVKEIKDILAVKCIADEVKFTERPTRKEIRKLVIKYTSLSLVVLGIMVSIFFGAIKVAAMLGL